MAREIRAVFFDIGDTLVFDLPDLVQRLVMSFNALGINVKPGDVDRGLRRAEAYLLPLYVTGVHTDDLLIRRKALEEICAEIGLSYLRDAEWLQFYRYFSGISFERVVHPDAVKLLTALKSRIEHLGVISDWDIALPSLLEGLGIGSYFDSMSVSGAVGAEKPSRILFDHALGLCKMDPTSCLHIGDFYELDYLGACSVGMQSLLFDWRSRSNIPGIWRVESFPELAQTVMGLL